MGKKILLPTDFSKNSWNAIQYAVKLHENQECDFYILNVYLEGAYGLNSDLLLDPEDGLNKLFSKKSNDGLGDILHRLMTKQPNIMHNFFVISRPTTLLKAIKDLTEQLSIDLVVMGEKGLSNGQEGKYGRKTIEIIQNIRKFPILVIPSDVKIDHPKEIVLATNYKIKFKVSELKYIVEIAKNGKAHIRVLSLSENGSKRRYHKRNKKLLQKYFKGIDYSFNELHNIKMADALSCFVEINKSNMISYINKQPSLWERLGFCKPSLGKMGYFAKIPVLALRG